MRVERTVPRYYDGLADVAFSEITDLQSPALARVDVAVLPAGASLPRHPAGRAQAFHVVAGQGRVAGSDDVAVPVGPGDTVTWEPGEEHTSWADTVMTVVIVQTRD